MALQITYIKKGVTYADSYHRVTYKKDKKNKTCQIVIFIYASKDFCAQFPQEYRDRETVEMHRSDFEKYIGKVGIDDGNYQNEASIYEFLKTVNPNELDSRYPECRFNYKDDSIDA